MALIEFQYNQKVRVTVKHFKFFSSTLNKSTKSKQNMLLHKTFYKFIVETILLVQICDWLMANKQLDARHTWNVI